MIEVLSPFQQFFDTDGRPLDDGYIYIGSSGLNPETSAITAYWDEAGTLPAAQPIRTIAGYPSRNGAPAIIFVNSLDYSISIRDKKSNLVASSTSISSYFGGVGIQLINTYATLRTITPTLSRRIRLGYGYTLGDAEFGDFYAITGASAGTYVDNGYSIIIPTGGDGSAAWLRDDKIAEGVTDLKTYTPISGMEMYLRYHTTLGDGGEGEFYSVSGAAPGTYVDDNGYTIIPTGGDGSSAWLRKRNGEAVNVLHFGPDITGGTGATSIFNAAQAISRVMRVPKGIYLLDNYRPANGEKWITDGFDNTIIWQTSAANPAINILSDVTSGQLLDLDIQGVSVDGSLVAAGTVAAVQITAASPYVVTGSKFEFKITNTNAALIMSGGSVLYDNDIKIISENTLHTSVVSTGVYNKYDFFLTQCQDGTAITDSSANSTFKRSITEGQHVYTGQNCTYINPTIEQIPAAVVLVGAAMQLLGPDAVILNPTLTDIDNAKSPYGFQFNGNQTVINPRIQTGTTLYPQYPFNFSAGSTTTLIGGEIPTGPYKLEQYIPPSQLSLLTLIGDVSTYSYQDLQKQNGGAYLNIESGATYTIDSVAGVSPYGMDKLVAFSGTGCTLTLPTPGSPYTHRIIRLINRVAFAVTSASSNVVPITGGAAGTAILPATAGKWVDIQCDGTNWNIIGGN